MKQILIVCSLAFTSCLPNNTREATSYTAPWEVHFSPSGGCTEQIVRNIDQAKHSIYIQAYSFTSGPIGEALVRAQARPVHIEIILDRSDEDVKNSLLPMMLENNITTFIDRKHAIAHNKVLIVDEEEVETGSFNYTAAAEKSNAENCLTLRDKNLAAAYLDNWKKHKQHSEPQ